MPNPAVMLSPKATMTGRESGVCWLRARKAASDVSRRDFMMDCVPVHCTPLHRGTRSKTTVYCSAMANCFDLTDRVVVAMGATSGIGRALAIGLAEHGATVIPAGRRADRI